MAVQRVQKQQDDLNSRLEGYYKRRDELIAELGKLKLTDEAITDIIAYARDVRAGFAEADFATKDRIFELLGVKVNVDRDKVRVTCAIPSTRSSISVANGVLFFSDWPDLANLVDGMAAAFVAAPQQSATKLYPI